jgi:hypothetical protein
MLRRVAFRPLFAARSSRFASSTTVLNATGWSEPVPGWEFHPLLTPSLLTPSLLRRAKSLTLGSRGFDRFRAVVPEQLLFAEVGFVGHVTGNGGVIAEHRVFDIWFT